jgi:methyl halide transferase
MSELLATNGSARLVILQFPNGKPLSMPGPPWGVNSGMYLALLSRPGEDIEHDEDGNVPDAEGLVRSDMGLRRLASFTPRRTHRQGMGEDGRVTDVVSVWTH